MVINSQSDIWGVKYLSVYCFWGPNLWCFHDSTDVTDETTSASLSISFWALDVQRPKYWGPETADNGSRVLLRSSSPPLSSWRERGGGFPADGRRREGRLETTFSTSFHRHEHRRNNVDYRAKGIVPKERSVKVSPWVTSPVFWLFLFDMFRIFEVYPKQNTL